MKIIYIINRLTAIVTAASASLFLLLLAQPFLLDFDLFPHQRIVSLDMQKENGKHERKWWKEAVAYEIYPASFKDSNGDGIGDIPGIVSKLDYLRDLGIDVIHICPHYQSPQVDMGYDVSDYEAIQEPYGTVEDVQALIDATHARGMKVIFDLVINHSSNLHKWFKESRSSKDDPKRDWYFWRPPKFDADGNRHPPNNWRSHFTGPAWTWDETTQEYYLHVYAPEMPDFNWENEEARQAIYNTSIIFWLERGIDGFRIDTVNKYSKDISFPDAKITDPGKETQPASRYYNHGPRIHEFLGEMKTIFERYDAMTVGELSHLPRDEKRVMEFVSASTGPLNMVFQFDLSNLGQKRKGDQKKGLANFELKSFKKEMSSWQVLASDPDAWVTLGLENHDAPRSISRFDSDFSLEDQVRVGKMFAVIMGTMTGTLFLYQGQEIGMVNAPREWDAGEYKDVRSGNIWKESEERCMGDEEYLASALEDLWMTARDHSRLPMQWSGKANAGFTSKDITPWMRVHDYYKKKNADLQLRDPDSLLEFWKKILRLRKEYKDLFIYGRYELVETGKKLFIFIKDEGGRKSLTVVNFSGGRKSWDGPNSILGPRWTLLIGTVKGGEVGKLAAWEGRVYLQSS